VQEEFSKGGIPGFVHLYAGEEAAAVGVCSHLGPRDYIASTHRGHGHSHGRLKPLPRQFDVGVDVWGFRPVTLGEILDARR